MIDFSIFLPFKKRLFVMLTTKKKWWFRSLSQSKQVTAATTTATNSSSSPKREVQSISDLPNLDQNVAFQKSRETSEMTLSRASSSSTTDEEIFEITNHKKNLAKPFNSLRTKLSTKTDANFNAVKLKRWSDYRKSWHQQMRTKSSPEKSLSKSEQHLSQIGTFS